MSGIKPTAYIKNKARVVIDNVQPNRQPLSTDHNRDENQVNRIAVTGDSTTADSSTDRSATRRLRRIQPGLGLLRAPSKEDTANTRSCDGHVVPVMSNPDSSSSTPLAIASVLHPSRGVSAVLPNSSRPTMPVKTLHLRKPPCDALLPDTGSELSSMDNFWARAPKPVLQPLVALPTQTSSGHFKERLEHGPTRELFRSRNFAESIQKPTAPVQHGTIESTRPQDIEQRLDSSVGRAADEPSPTNDPASDDKSYDSDNSSDKTPNARLSSRQAPHWMDESEITESGRTYSNAAIQDEQPGCTSPTVDSSSIPPFQAPINRKPESQMMRKDDSCLPYSLSVTRTVQGGLKRQAMENHSQAVAKERRTRVSSKVELLPPKLLRERTSSPYTKHMQRSIISRPSSAHSSREDTSSSRGPDTKHKLDILIGDTTRLRDELDQTDKENHRIREKCSQKTLELEKYKRDVKNIVTNIKSKQNKLSTQYSEIQSNVTGFIDSSREKLASSREDIGSIRKECSDLMKSKSSSTYPEGPVNSSSYVYF
ncbi:uncharacterized protein MELLADRAFT_88658 [Melampsora larici-populina 98AG31]|uniref:Uncharacterized protein n=1 Tax=Melampsora larici-populina (strain 98AG31 / pathotype 3-4-7) TaxID=747676 RepID=F4RSI7_MELLP|nr:uncharacterized protein MELLADRAFT_88658 [Melampsora larici-populina 98AG31]EGG04608.1 hypothetical protein MELLADRAFT_88658 [Melampsora larici-populina 98AG31]